MGADDAAATEHVTVIVMTSPARLPERARLLRRTVSSAIAQRLAPCWSHDVLVLDDGPAGAGWAHIAALVPAARERGVELRYVALPPDASGSVNMRLKRNAGLLLSAGDAAAFFDDDDWRGPESLQAQLDELAAAAADVCTLQVQHVCELDPAARAVRYFDLADGGGLFSARLGNPGTAVLRRTVWESNPSVGFPDTPCEDVDFARLLLADSPLLGSVRPRRCTHVLLDAAALSRQGRAHATFMTVRLVGYRHEWPLRALDRSPAGAPPPCLAVDDARFYAAHCAALSQGLALGGGACDADANGGSPTPLTPPPPPPPGLEAVLAEASRRMEGATRALLLLSALRQANSSVPGGPGPGGPGPSPSVGVASAVKESTDGSCGKVGDGGLGGSEDVHGGEVDGEVGSLLLQLHAACGVLSAAHAAGGGDATEGGGAPAEAVRALIRLKECSASRRATASTPAASGASAGASVAQRMIDGGVMRSVVSVVALLGGGAAPDAATPPFAPSVLELVSLAAELAEEILFRTDHSSLDLAPRAAAADGDGSAPADSRAGTEGAEPLSAMAGVLANTHLEPATHAAAAGALQHMLSHAEARARLAGLPPCATPLVAALRSPCATTRRRAAGAVCNAAAHLDTLAVLVDAGAPTALATALSAPLAPAPAGSPPAVHAPLRALERLCAISATAREQADEAMPHGALLSRLAEELSGAHAPTRALASRLVATLSRSEARHWLPVEARRPKRTWPHDSIVYYTGVALEPWGPERLDTGLGGSETAVLQLASRWARADADGRAREVVVYLRLAGGDRSERTWRGVSLRDVSTFSPEDGFGTLVVWRSLEILDLPLSARLVLLDLHDMPLIHEISPRRLAAVWQLTARTRAPSPQRQL